MKDQKKPVKKLLMMKTKIINIVLNIQYYQQVKFVFLIYNLKLNILLFI